MKVVHINEHLTMKGGVEAYMLSLLPTLQQRGIDVHVLYGAGDPAAFGHSSRIVGIKAASFGSQQHTRKQVAEALERERPDVIHLHNFQSIGVLQACFAHGPTIMHAHDYRSVCPASNFFYKRTQEVCSRQCGPGCFTTTLTKHCLTPRPRYASYYYYRSKWATGHSSRFAHVIAPSGDTRERLERAGFESGRISVMPYYCPVQPAARPRPVPRQATITYIGRIAPNKGHDVFVRALGELPPHVRGVMVGGFSEDAEREVLALARACGCEDRLHLRKWATREEVVQILDETSILVFPSLWPETLGIIGLEALARGIPVVASDVGGVREWLRDGENGRLVQPKSPAEIGAAVLDLLSDDGRLLAHGEAGIRTIQEKFLPTRHTDDLVRLYERFA